MRRVIAVCSALALVNCFPYAVLAAEIDASSASATTLHSANSGADSSVLPGVTEADLSNSGAQSVDIGEAGSGKVGAANGSTTSSSDFLHQSGATDNEVGSANAAAPAPAKATGMTGASGVSLAVQKNPSNANLGSAVTGVSGKNSGSVNSLPLSSQAGAAVRLSQKGVPAHKQTKPESGLSYSHQYPDTAPYALVSIQFPVYCDGSTVEQINHFSAFKKFSTEGVKRMVDEQMIKSSYFAAEFYNYLSSRLPQNSVVLVPTRLQVGKDGTIETAPLSKAVPSVLTLDFYAFVNPERVRLSLLRQGAFSSDDTYGNRLKVYTHIYRTDNSAKTELIAGTPIFNKKANRFGLNLTDFYNVHGNGEHGSEVRQVAGRDVIKRLPLQDNSFFELPTATSSSSKIFSLHVSQDGAEPLFEPLWSTYSDVLISYLNQSDPEKHVGAMIASQVGDMDPDMAKYFEQEGATSKSSVDAMKAQFFRVYLNKERAELFAPLSQSTADALCTGDFGNSTRALLKSELNYYEKYTASQRRKMAASLIGIAATAGSIATSIAVPSYGLGGLLGALAAVSTSIATSESHLEESLTQYFREFEMQATTVQRQFVLKFDSDVIEVSGDSIQSLRAQAKDKYHEIFDVKDDLASDGQVSQ